MVIFEKPSCADGSDEAVLAFPKRLKGKMLLCEKHGWGLHACEHLSFIRVVILCLIIQSYPIWFFVDWIKHHPEDYQNACVPLVLGFCFIQTFMIVPNFVS